MKSEVLIDKSFDPASLGKYHLSLQIGNDSFIACVTKIKSGHIVGIASESFKGELKHDFHTSAFIDTLKNCPLKISKKYASVSISVSNLNFSIVPKALFDVSQLSQYVQLNATPNKNYEYLHSSLKNDGLVVGFALPKDLKAWISKVFPSAKIHHEIGVSIAASLRDYNSLSSSRIVLNVHFNHFDFIYIKEGKLNFANSFSFESEEDFLYFTLFTCEQLEINPHEIQTYLLGNIKRGGALHQLLFQYIKNLEFGQINKNIKISNGLTGLPKHSYYNTFNQYLCE